MIEVHHCDARTLPLADGSVQTIVTSPPYWGLRDYGLPPSVWGGAPMCEHEWGDGIRIHKGGPHGPGVLLAGGRSVVDGQASTKNINAGRFCAKCSAWLGCLGLEPTPELFVEHIVEVFREAWRVLRPDGTLWLNIGDSYANDGKWGGSSGGKHVKELHGDSGIGRGRRFTGLKPKDLVGIPWMVAFALRAAGWYLRSEIIWHKPNPMPESVIDRPTKAHEQVFLFSKSEKYFYDAAAIKESVSGTAHARGRGVHPKSAPADSGIKSNESFSAAVRGLVSERNRRSVWTIATQPTSVAHFATMPEALVEPCILAGSRPNDIVLDPFAGSGTVGRVALRLGRRAVLCDLNETYLRDIVPKRICNVQLPLAGGVR